MYTIKEACEKVSMSYGTLKFYCNNGLVPNVKRDKNNYRIFNDSDIAWIISLRHLKNCGMSIKEMKEYLVLCLEGEKTIPIRKKILEIKKEQLEFKLKKMQENIDYVDNKQKFYDSILSGEVEYYSNLLD